MTETTNTIIWLEDNAHEDELIAIAEAIEEKYVLRVAEGVGMLRKEIDETKENKEKIRGIILDMMIHGITSLASFDMPEVKWSKGYSHVGELVLKHVFRNQESDDFLYFRNIPILILSVKSDICKGDFKEYGSDIKVIQKYDGISWERDVIKWISSLKT